MLRNSAQNASPCARPFEGSDQRSRNSISQARLALQRRICARGGVNYWHASSPTAKFQFKSGNGTEPNLDALESARFDQQGFNSDQLASLIQPCDQFLFAENPGRADVADWIRTVYHDMATYNITDGTGGLDGSIRFDQEQARPDNAGDGFSNTMLIIFSTTNRYVTISDAIALAAIIAIENCAGPEIAFCSGRVDAGEPNAPGGFTQTEMIGLVACGHTFGGVQQSFFPDIVGNLNDPNDTENVAHFDTTFVTFDNKVATEYVSGTTRNPLVVGFNDTTNSDKRIFGSDGNATIRSFANSLELYTSTCADLFARMLNTVPRGVQLTDVTTSLPVKPDNLQLIMDNDTLLLSAQARLWNQPEDASRTVRILMSDHIGGTKSTPLAFAGTASSTGGRYNSAWYAINGTTSTVSLEPAAGIKSLSFVVDGTLENQGGIGFAVQDSFMMSQTSCLTTPSTLEGHLDVAVRNGVNLERLYVKPVTSDSIDRLFVVEIDIPRPAKPVAINSAYSLWSLNLTNAFTLEFVDAYLGAEIDGVKYTNTIPSLFDLPPCAS
ncbi:putative L-ascorbate oxidase [Mycena galericulata]|nr:putative L-ascorbate oxidase [Mycena galericulata]